MRFHNKQPSVIPTQQLSLVKSMIATAAADGLIDTTEQRQKFNAVEEMELNADEKRCFLTACAVILVYKISRVL